MLFGEAIFAFVNKRCHLDETISLLSLQFANEKKILNLGLEKNNKIKLTERCRTRLNDLEELHFTSTLPKH